MRTIETYLPIFTGFYNTIFEPDEDNEVYSINQEREQLGLKELDFDSFEFDYKEYESDVGIYACDYIEKELNAYCPQLEVKIKFQRISSPKYYNFSNDAINCEIELNIDSLVSYLLDNFEAFTGYIKEKYTSCSGFISSYSNDSKEWIKYLTKEVKLHHVIGSCLDFVVLNEIDEPEMEMYEHCRDNVYISCTNYDELIKQ